MKKNKILIISAIALIIWIAPMCSNTKHPSSIFESPQEIMQQVKQTSLPIRLNVPFGDIQKCLTFYGYDSCRVALTNLNERPMNNKETFYQEKDFAVDYYRDDKTMFIYHRNKTDGTFYMNILYIQNGEGEYIRKFEHHELKVQNELITIHKDGKLVYYQH